MENSLGFYAKFNHYKKVSLAYHVPCYLNPQDECYWERRRKNNEAAKRSRDSRRAKEDEIAIRAAFLEQENFKLRIELNKLKEEMAKLQ